MSLKKFQLLVWWLPTTGSFFGTYCKCDLFQAETTVEDPLPMALLKLHELAVANKLVERYEKVEEDKTAGATACKITSLKVVLFLGNEIYQGTGVTIKAAKQQAAVQALQNTKYQTKEEKKATIPTLSKCNNSV